MAQPGEVVDHMVTEATATQYSSRVPKVLIRTRKKANKRKVVPREDKRTLAANYDESHRNRLIGEAMRFILMCNSNMEKCTTKKIQDASPSISELNKWQFIELMSLVQSRFYKVFGYNLLSDNSKPATSSGKGVTQPGYGNATESWLLVNGMDTSDVNREAHAKDERVAERGFLMTVLAIIMLEGSVVTEDKLWEHLGQVNLDVDGAETRTKRMRSQVREDEICRDPKKALNELLRKMYIRKRKNNAERNKNGTTMLEYSFGSRTLDEIGKHNIARFIMQTSKTALPTAELLQLLGINPTDALADDEESEDESESGEQEAQEGDVKDEA